MYEELLGQIDSFFTGKLGLKEFELWIVGNLQRFLSGGDKEAIEAIDRIDVSLVQLGDDVIDQLEFADVLLGILTRRPGAKFSRLFFEGFAFSQGHEASMTSLAIRLAPDVPVEYVGTSTSALTSPREFAIVA